MTKIDQEQFERTRQHMLSYMSSDQYQVPGLAVFMLFVFYITIAQIQSWMELTRAKALVGGVSPPVKTPGVLENVRIENNSLMVDAVFNGVSHPCVLRPASLPLFMSFQALAMKPDEAEKKERMITNAGVCPTANLPTSQFEIRQKVNGVDRHVGFGFRSGNYGITCCHNVKENPTREDFTIVVERNGKFNSFPLNKDNWSIVCFSDPDVGLDILVLETKPSTWAVMKITSAKIALGLPITSLLSLYCYDDSGKPSLRTGRIKARSYNNRAFMFEHLCSTDSGASGAPLFDTFGNVVGIHLGSSGTSEANFGVSLCYLKRILEDKESGENFADSSSESTPSTYIENYGKYVGQDDYADHNSSTAVVHGKHGYYTIKTNINTYTMSDVKREKHTPFPANFWDDLDGPLDPPPKKGIDGIYEEVTSALKTAKTDEVIANKAGLSDSLKIRSKINKAMNDALSKLKEVKESGVPPLEYDSDDNFDIDGYLKWKAQEAVLRAREAQAYREAQVFGKASVERAAGKAKSAPAIPPRPNVATAPKVKFGKDKVYSTKELDENLVAQSMKDRPPVVEILQKSSNAVAIPESAKALKESSPGPATQLSPSLGNSISKNQKSSVAETASQESGKSISTSTAPKQKRNRNRSRKPKNSSQD